MDSKIWKVQSWLYYAWLFYDVLCKLGCRYQTWQQICRCNEKIQSQHWLILRFFGFLHVHMYCLCMLSGYSLEDWLWPHLWFLLYNQVISSSCSHMFAVDAVLFTKEIPHGRDLSGWELEVLLISISHRPQICNESQPSDDFPTFRVLVDLGCKARTQGIYLICGRDFMGFHTRFRDVSRGGIRQGTLRVAFAGFTQSRLVWFSLGPLQR